MQYILTQQEYDSLKENQTLKVNLNKDKLQKLCTNIANTMPIIFWNHKEAQPWNCKLTDEHGDEWYCDECPVQDICPSDDKDWSK